jgi:hydrogenase maturation protease
MKIGIIGLGNPLRGDDGIGIVIVDELKKLVINKNIELVDAGEGGFNLLHHLQRFNRVLIIDAVVFGGRFGETKLFTINDIAFDNICLYSHEINICKIVDILRLIGDVPDIFIFGIQPKEIDYNKGLSKELNVKKITEEALEIINRLENL